MWTITSKEIQKDQIIQYQILENETPVTNKRVLELWINDAVFREFYNSVLKESSLPAYFWENPPMTTHSLNRDYEFVLVNSNTLNRISARPSSFEDYFEKEKEVVVFPNLGRDATLVVPTPIIENDYYSHIANFVRNAPTSQIDTFWKAVGESYQSLIGEQKKWLSTSGLGVYWLHVRIDSRPKYYQYRPYRMGEY